MKNLLKVGLACGIFVLNGVLAFADSFPDVSKDHKNYEAIEYLDGKQIINGYKDGTFGPSNLLNRAEAIKIIVGALNIPHDLEYEVLFPDVKKEEWFFSFVMGAQKAGIVGGYKDGKFKPGESVNLAETLKMIFVAAKVSLPTVSADVFIDAKKDSWFAPYMLFARNNNIILPDDYGYIHPDQAMTRAYFAEIVYRTIIVLESGGKPFPLNKNWPVFTSKNLPFKIKYDDERFEVIVHDEEVVFFKPDKEFVQFSPKRVYPNSASVTLTLDENVLSAAKTQYFSNLKAAFKGYTFEEYKLAAGLDVLEISSPAARTIDGYVYLADGKVLAIYADYGNGSMSYQLQQFIKAMLESLEITTVKNGAKDYTDLLSEIFDSVLVENKGLKSIEKLPDEVIIETDALGVGTGPVDYYYSKEVGYTFKYERSKDVILDKREGETSAF